MAKSSNKQHTISTYFPPVVAVLGHVDHGKTTLLDTLRSTSIAKREFGGITQNIGASTVETEYEGRKKKLTFIDTPGHEAFSAMRSRGAQVADIGLLIVSAVDGVMPQTRESIHLLKTAKIPFIVVLTMSDLETKNPEKVKQQLVREDVLLEGYGGDIPVIEVSAISGLNIKELLGLILLVAELHEINKQVDPNGALKAIVIESKRDLKIGARATVVIKNGTIHTRDELSCEGISFRIRMIVNDIGQQLTSASVGQGIELYGMDIALSIGSVITTKESALPWEIATPKVTSPMDFVYHKLKDEEGLSIILCADTQGSLEAIIAALPKKVTIVAQKTGEITEADVLQAKTIGAIILSFNTKIRSDIKQLALVEKVLVNNYRIIYEMIDEINDVLEGKRQLLVEIILGRAKVLASFPYEKTLAFGVALTEGRIAKNDKVRVMRGDLKIGETTIQSLRVGKNPVAKVNKGEAGVVFTSTLDITIGDMLISFS
jgi:translation initiation factor IF-2